MGGPERDVLETADHADGEEMGGGSWVHLGEEMGGGSWVPLVEEMGGPGSLLVRRWGVKTYWYKDGFLHCLSPAHTMRFSSSVGRRDDEKTIVAWCVRTKDDRRPLILQTRQLLDRFEERIGPTTVAWCVRVNDICRINRPITDQSQ